MRQRSVVPDRVAVLAGVWVVVVVAVITVMIFAGPSSSVAQISGNVTFLIAIAFCVVAATRAAIRRRNTRLAWLLIAFGFGMGFIGQASFVVSALTHNNTPVSPTANVIAFVGYYIPMIAALLAFPRPGDRAISRFRGLIDVLVITLSVILISEGTVLRTVRDTLYPTPLEKWLAIGYPVADIAICALALSIGVRQIAGNRLAWVMLGGGMISLAVTDSIFVRLQAGGIPVAELTASPLMIGWLAAPLLTGLATMIPMTGDRTVDEDHTGVTLAVRLVPNVPVVGAMIIFGLGGALGDRLLLIGGIVLLIIVTVRQITIVYENVLLTRGLEDKVAARTAELATQGSIITSATDAVIGLSIDERIITWNPAAERLYGFSAPAMLGEPVDAVPGLDEETTARLIDQAHRGEPLPSFEVQWERPDGTSVPIAMSLSPIRDNKGVQGISVYAQDITERRRQAAALEQARQEALESSRLKSEFLATMSHEIRTPMNGVIGLTSLLLETDLTPDQRQYADGVRGAGEALLGVINDILDFSKLEAGKVVLDPTDFDPRQLVEEVGALLAPTASAKRLELIAYCLPEVPATLCGDPGRIRQILLNLASNALKFTEFGEVSIKVRATEVSQDSYRLRVEVSDTGIGIAEEDQTRLFQSFSQADASTTRRFGGTGLGLAISRRLVEVMGGSIGLRSEAGQGSVFWFELPLRSGREAVIAPAGTISHELLKDLRALIVDDNATNRTILEAQLRSWQLLPEQVADARTAFERLRAAAGEGHPHDLVVLDLMMPDVDGLELARQITADPLLTGIPMVMLTSGADAEPHVMTAAGIGQWLSKPVRSSELYDRLVRLMAPKEAELVARRRSRPQRPSVRPGSRGQVLVVEDNALNQMVAEGVVARLGFDVDIVEDGIEALIALEQHSYHAVLMDCHMPRMDGFAATREIRLREAGTRHIPIIAMTAGAMSEDRDRCLRVGMDAYISKPVDLDALEATLDAWAHAPIGPLPRTLTDDESDVAVDIEPIDRTRLADLRELSSPDGASLLELMIESFVGRARNRMETIEAAAGSDDHDVMAAAAHELKGAAGTIGAVHVAEVCRQLESRAREGRHVDRELVGTLAHELERASNALQRVDVQMS